MSTLKVDTILKRTGTGTITLGQSGDTISIPSGATLNSAGTNTLSGVASEYFSTTAFYATMDGSQNISHNTETKVAFSQETYDLGSNYDTSSYTYTAPSAGYYRFDVSVHVASESDGQMKTTRAFIRFTPSGGSASRVVPSFKDNESSRQRREPHTFGIVRLLAANEAVEIFGYANVTSGTPLIYYDGTYAQNYFSGYRIH